MSFEGVARGVGEPRPGQEAQSRPVVEPYNFLPESAAKEVIETATCPQCGGPTRVARARTNMWKGDRLIVVEDIPAHMCDRCGEQYYSELVADALRTLLQDELETAKPKREMVVPVHSFEGRIKVPEHPSQDLLAYWARAEQQE